MQKLFHNEAPVRLFCLDLLSEKILTLTNQLEEASVDRLEQRLARYLLNRNQEIVSMSHAEIAAHLGSSREIVTRKLCEFQKNGWVKVDRRSIQLVLPERLRTHAIQ